MGLFAGTEPPLLQELLSKTAARKRKGENKSQHKDHAMESHGSAVPLAPLMHVIPFSIPPWASGLWKHQDLHGKHLISFRIFNYLCGKSKTGCFPTAFQTRAEVASSLKSQYFLQEIYIIVISPPKKIGFCQSFPWAGGEGHSEQATKCC